MLTFSSGYYQLKANPGVWDLRLGDGRHSEIYRIVGGNRSIAVMDFVGSTELLHVCYIYFIL